MLGAELDEAFDRLLPLRQGLLWQPHHEVKADVVEPCRPSEPVSLSRAGGVVHAIETSELLVPEGLDAQAEAIHAGRAEPVQLLCARRLGIHLEGNLGVHGQVEGSAAGFDQGGDLGGVEE